MQRVGTRIGGCFFTESRCLLEDDRKAADLSPDSSSLKRVSWTGIPPLAGSRLDGLGKVAALKQQMKW